MTAWRSNELDRVAAADGLTIAARRADGTLRAPVPIWVVRVGDDLYVRSWRGLAGRWFRAARDRREGHLSAGGIEKDVVFADADEAVNDAIDVAYGEKYGRYPSYIPPMIAPQAQATTLKLVPDDRGGTS
jgi:hypothetical protein